MKNNKQQIATQLVHSGECKLPKGGFASTPIIQSSTFFRSAAAQPLEFEYSRTSNPTRAALEESIAALEKGKHCFCFSSGVAAIQAATSLLTKVDEIICYDKSYSGTKRIFNFLQSSYGIKVHFKNFKDIDELKELVNKKTKMIWLETPSNPLLEVLDLTSIVKEIRLKSESLKSEIYIAADNTFATPFFQNPLIHGVDIVVHSASKYLGGHSDAILGAVVCNDDKIAEKLKFIQNAFGSIPSPMECFLILRGIKTLHIRMERHAKNAQKVMELLASHPKVKTVFFPDIKKSKNLIKQMTGFGGVVSFTLKKNSASNAANFLNNLNLIKIAESLGGVESLATAPAIISQKMVPKVSRLKIGIEDSLIRISAGIESYEDLVNDINNALKFCN